MTEHQTAGELAAGGGFRIDAAQMEKMREIARVVYDDPSRIAEFERDPMAFAKSVNGFEPPAGVHLQVAAPADCVGGRCGQRQCPWRRTPSWDRLEFRVGYKTVSLVACM